MNYLQDHILVKGECGVDMRTVYYDNVVFDTFDYFSYYANKHYQEYMFEILGEYYPEVGA